eukprot:SAG11_NODE_19201_length_472_cov_0.689008_1_plen_106_part_01
MNALQHLKRENASLRAQLESMQSNSEGVSYVVDVGGDYDSFEEMQKIIEPEEEDDSLLQLIQDTLEQQRLYLGGRTSKMNAYRRELGQISCEDGGLGVQLDALSTM